MPYFVVHEHHAKRLHYDFRLEMDGVLKSWAVPKGPSMSPRDKRLAIMVDDHALEYGTFEGTIPEGQYGAGPVVIWDSGEYDPVSGSIDKGRIEFYMNGKKLKGLFVLIKLKRGKNDWLLVKKKDEHSVDEFRIEQALTGD